MPIPVLRCANTAAACPRTTIAPGTWALRQLSGVRVRLCSACADLYDAGHYCHLCEQEMYGVVGPHKDAAVNWVYCSCCTHFAHRQCERKSGTDDKSQAAQATPFRCRLCRCAGCLPDLCLVNKGSAPQPRCLTEPTCFNLHCDDSSQSTSWVEIHPHSSTGSDGAWLCSTCNVRWRQRQVCQYCLKFRPMATKETGQWLSCCHCNRAVHLTCEVSAGYNDATAIYAHQPETYQCPDCRMVLPPPPPKASFYEFTKIMLNEAARRNDAVCLSPSRSAAGGRAAAPSTNSPKAANTRPHVEGGGVARAAVPSPKRMASPSMGNSGSTVNELQCDSARYRKWRNVQPVPGVDGTERVRATSTCTVQERNALQRVGCDAVQEPPALSDKALARRGKKFAADRTSFYSQLHLFLEKLGIPLTGNSTVGGKELDLYHLYLERSARYSCDAVVAVEDARSRIFGSNDDYSSSVTDARYRLKQFYFEIFYWYDQHFRSHKPMSEIIDAYGKSKRASRRSCGPALPHRNMTPAGSSMTLAMPLSGSPVKSTMAEVSPPCTPAHPQSPPRTPRRCSRCGRPGANLGVLHAQAPDFKSLGLNADMVCGHCTSAPGLSSTPSPASLRRRANLFPVQMTARRQPRTLPLVLRCDLQPSASVASCLP